MAEKVPKQPRPRPGVSGQEQKAFEGFEYMKERTTEELRTFLAFKESPLFKFYLEVVEKTWTNLGSGLLLDTKLIDTPHALPMKQGYAEGIKFFNGILNDVQRELQWRDELNAARDAADESRPSDRAPRSVRA
jgi:hypothetical protein